MYMLNKWSYMRQVNYQIEHSYQSLKHLRFMKAARNYLISSRLKIYNPQILSNILTHINVKQNLNHFQKIPKTFLKLHNFSNSKVYRLMNHMKELMSKINMITFNKNRIIIIWHTPKRILFHFDIFCISFFDFL